ncbi:MAG: lipid II flippase MurJ, partial [Candidatus Acidiferrales bacterium]
MTEKGKILKSASVVALATVISRICGYLRDQRVALLLGTSPAADSFILAFRIPNMIRRMTGEGALGASFVPVFVGYLRGKPSKETWQFARRAFWDAAVILAVVAVLGSIFSRQIIGIFTALGMQHVRWDLAVYLNRIIFPCVFFLGLAALASAILISFHQ